MTTSRDCGANRDRRYLLQVHWLRAALALLLTSCAGSAADNLQRTPGGLTPTAESPGTALPAPSVLLERVELRAASFTEEGLFRLGGDFESELPSNRVFVQNPGADYLPAFGPNDPLEQAAYAMYLFDALDYDRAPELRLNWNEAPIAGQAYLGLANFGQDRWNFFSANTDVVTLASLAPYIAGDGRVLVTLLLIGEETAKLASIRIGEAHPQAVLLADVTEGTAPLTVNFDASDSTTIDGTLTKFEWDFDGDGDFEQDSGDVATIQNIYPDGGTFSATVRITNSLGNTATAAIEITVAGEWLHTLASELTFSNQMSAVAPLPDGGFMTTGYSQDFFNNFKQVQTRWDRDGNLEWAMIGSEMPRFPIDCAVDSAGNVVVAGAANGVALLQKWNPAGELLWQRLISGTEVSVAFGSVCTVGEDIFVCGNFEVEFSDDPDALICRFDGNGELIWNHAYDWFRDSGVDLEPRMTDSGVDSVFALVHVTKTTAPVRLFPLYAAFQLDGDFLGDGCNFTNTQDLHATALALEHNSDNGVTRAYITCSSEDAEPALLLTAHDLVIDGLLRSAVYCRTWDALLGSQCNELLLRSDGRLVLAGGTDDHGLLITADKADGTVLGAERLISAGTESTLLGMAFANERVICVGRGYIFPASWQSESTETAGSELIWGLGAGTVPSETLTAEDDTQTFSDLEVLHIDDTERQNQSLINYRPLPGTE